LCVGPVNNVIHLLAVYYHEGKGSYRYNRHVERLADFMWVGREGMMMNGTNGAQLWDTAFTIAAAFEADLAGDKEFIPCLTKALEFLDDMQVSPPSSNTVADIVRSPRTSPKKHTAINVKEHGLSPPVTKATPSQTAQQKVSAQSSSSNTTPHTPASSPPFVSNPPSTSSSPYKTPTAASHPTNSVAQDPGWNSSTPPKSLVASW
jgi:hypothetical protein